MRLGYAGHEAKHSYPDEAEEGHAEAQDLPGFSVVGDPEDYNGISARVQEQSEMALTVPVSTVGRAQEEILENDNHPIPEHDLSSEDRLVERRNFAGRLTIVIWQAEVDDQTNYPEENRNGSTNRSVFSVTR